MFHPVRLRNPSNRSSRFAEASSAGRQCSAQSGPRGAACCAAWRWENGEFIHQKWSHLRGQPTGYIDDCYNLVQLHLLRFQCYISSIHQLKIRYFLARYLRFLPDVSRIVLAKHQLWGYSTTVTGVSVEMFFLLFAHGHGLEIL